jgi:hypothetical protein
LNRSLVHLGMALGDWPERHDEAGDRAAAREILIGLLLQDLPPARVRAIRSALRRAIAVGTAEDREEVGRLAVSVAGWYDRVASGESGAEALTGAFDDTVAAIENFAGRHAAG